ncbi:transcription factor MYB124-like [Tasmannia lanceolata]|uniref:transcription factor MYB124-like n=1 Tax=Tasmannia lanceolata TaxID=3420 RepID=UPI004062CBB7
MHAVKNVYEAPKSEPMKQKDRHIVTWSPQEDEMLRQLISIHGTESWTAIAARLNDKTSRQCRRRWYTYLNSDCKKGGWSPEEDMILCEAQKIFGNRWTEIAKVVSGRTDNAVKNRFSTLCKKRAKHEALSKENNSVYINSNNKRVILHNGQITPEPLESTAPLKKIRTQISDPTEKCNMKESSLRECGMGREQLRAPLAVLVQNFNYVDDLPTIPHVINNTKAALNDRKQLPNLVEINNAQGTFLKRDDPKIRALMQQSELLSSLALKVYTENTNQSLENAWKELQDFLIRTEESELLRCKITEMDILLEDFKDFVEDAKCNSIGSQLSCRQPNLQEESHGSSANSTGSTHQWHSTGDKTEHHTDGCLLNQNSNIGTHLTRSEVEIGSGCGDGFCPTTSPTQAAIMSSCEEQKDGDQIISASLSTEFGSPLQMIPPFQSFAEGIPSPKFTDSERRFLLSTLGLISPSPNGNSIPSQPPPPPPPPCKRALLHSL